MRISLTPEADQSLSEIFKRVLNQNPFIERDNGRLISAVIVSFLKSGYPKKIEEIAQTLTTQESARLALIREVEGLSQGMDATALRALEMSLKRFRQPSQTISTSKLQEENQQR